MLEKLHITNDMAFIILFCSIIVLLILYIVLLILQLNNSKRYRKFMTGANARNLEGTILERIEQIEDLKKSSAETRKILDNAVVKSFDNYQKVSLRKYDAFKEMGGKLSFSLCLLDGNDNGFILTSMHSSREGSYTYIKEIIKGEAFVLLAEEEKKTLEEAKNKSGVKKE